MSLRMMARSSSDIFSVREGMTVFASSGSPGHRDTFGDLSIPLSLEKRCKYETYIIVHVRNGPVARVASLCFPARLIAVGL
jgi:hypothetical protein